MRFTLCILNYTLLLTGGCFMKKYLILSVLFLIVLPIATYAASEVGMVTQISGKVTYQSASDSKPADVRNFMKVYEGDMFSLSADSFVQLVYLRSGRKETWKGPGNFKAGDQQGKSQNSSLQPKAGMMDTEKARQIVLLSDNLDPSRLQRTGSTIARGEKKASQAPPRALSEAERKKIADAKQNYQDMLKDADAGDITPELYMFSVFADYDQFTEMKLLLAEMRKKQPDNKDIDHLEEWMNKLQ